MIFTRAHALLSSLLYSRGKWETARSLRVVNLASVCQSDEGGSVFTIQSYISGKITGKLEVFSSQIIWIWIWWKRQREDIKEHSFLEAFIRPSPWFPENVRLKPAWEAHKKGKERGSSSTQERERRPRGAQARGKRKHLTPRQPRPFPSCLEPLFQSEAKCNVIDMKMIIFSCKLQERFCTLPGLESWTFLNSEMACSLNRPSKNKISQLVVFSLV